MLKFLFCPFFPPFLLTTFFFFFPQLKLSAQFLCVYDIVFILQAGDTVVGFMSLCSQVDVSLFHACFDLGPFHGLCKPHPEDVLKAPQEPSIPEGTYMLKL